jgi:hypothetical protein
MRGRKSPTLRRVAVGLIDADDEKQLGFGRVSDRLLREATRQALASRENEKLKLLLQLMSRL